MIINLNNIHRLQEFFKSKSTDEQLDECTYCRLTQTKYNCKDYDMCSKYTGSYNNTLKLIDDLFDTIDYLVATKGDTNEI